MASSYVFRKIDGELWQRMRGACMTDGLRFLDVTQQLFKNWLQQRQVDAVTAAQSKPRKQNKETK